MQETETVEEVEAEDTGADDASSWDTDADDTEAKFATLEFSDELVSELPPAAGSLYASAIEKLVRLSEENETGGWMRVATGGRNASSVQTGLQGASRSLGVRIQTRTRTESDGSKVVFVKLAEEGAKRRKRRKKVDEGAETEVAASSDE